ncbi:PAAR domain-containing protein, partial [Pseudomonas sp. UFMG81]|uniref:PAAR domain-containing protein n=1 Tax=Pseudomonas sp. UFMG81 TaxID=2745936 RepID=UPI001E62C19A
PQQAFTPAHATATPGGLEPGFHIVQRSSSFPELILRLTDGHGSLPIARLQRLNPTYAQGFKAGEIFVIGDPDNGHACTREEAELMAAANRARAALTDLSHEEANFMMRHQAEIAGLLSDVSLAMGVSQAVMAKSLSELKDTLHHIEKLHQDQFRKHGHLQSDIFFAERKKLFNTLDTTLRTSFLNKQLNLGTYETLRRDLGLSSKSLVHHWSKAGIAGDIPGYATHLDKLASMSKYLKAGGRVGVALGGASSFLKIYEACTAGNKEACNKIGFTETGSFMGGLIGGAAGGAVGGKIAGYACLGLGAGAPACSVVVVGISSLAMSLVGMHSGEKTGEVIYELLEQH